MEFERVSPNAEIDRLLNKLQKDIVSEIEKAECDPKLEEKEYHITTKTEGDSNLEEEENSIDEKLEKIVHLIEIINLKNRHDNATLFQTVLKLEEKLNRRIETTRSEIIDAIISLQKEKFERYVSEDDVHSDTKSEIISFQSPDAITSITQSIRNSLSISKIEITTKDITPKVRPIFI